MSRVKDLFIFLRNGLAFSFSWLVICTMAVSAAGGAQAVGVAFLLKLLVLCFWGVLSFGVSFKLQPIRKKGFIFSLTMFYVLFIPVEVLLFYLMGIFDRKGSVAAWLVFGGILAAFYLSSLLIDIIVMKRKEKIYTEKMAEYLSRER